MNSNSITTALPVPLNILLRRRREELKLLQAHVAEALHVTPECIGRWEDGSRRMELSKLPRIAKVLQLDTKVLCTKALEEFHPVFYDALFGHGAVVATHNH